MTARVVTSELEHEQRQLIERIGDFEADQNQRGDHQIKAEMHEGLETSTFAACADLSPATPTRMASTQIIACRDIRWSIVCRGTEGLRRRGSDALVASLFLNGGLYSDESVPSVLSDALENLDSPQHHDDGRHQCGRRQHTL